MNFYLLSYYVCMAAVGANFCMMFFVIFMCLHMAYTRLDEVLSYFENCPAIVARTPLRHGGPWGEIMLVGGISGFVIFPGMYLKNGGMSEDDLNNLPPSLKKRFAVIQWGLVVSLVLMLLLAGGAALLRPYVVL